MKYQLGVMSNKWEVEAENVDIATCAVYMHTMSSAPIVCYSPEEKSRFMVMVNATDEKMKEFEDFMEENGKAIREAYRSIKTRS